MREVEQIGRNNEKDVEKEEGLKKEAIDLKCAWREVEKMVRTHAVQGQILYGSQWFDSESFQRRTEQRKE